MTHTAPQRSESLLWNLSGSTLAHILVILGLGFYISQSDPIPLKHTISLNLVSSSQLSSKTQLGADAKPEKILVASPEKSQAASPEIQHKRIVHTDENQKPFDRNAFLLEQKRLIKEIKKQAKVLEKALRTGFLGVYDARPAYQQYQTYWQSYVSQFGTEHYPSILVENSLSGSLELDITIDRQGVVRSTDIHRSSGNVEIDNAAIQIAMLASPYKPLPDEIASEYDALHIIRTWDFRNNALRSRAVGLN